MAVLVAHTIDGDQPLFAVDADRVEAPVVVVLPALGIRAAYYQALATALAARGVHAVVADHPGHGESPVRARRGRHWGYPEIVRSHLPALLEAVHRRHEPARVFLLGHSLGGQVAMMGGGALAEQISGIALVAAGTPWWRCWGLSGVRLWLMSLLVSSLSWALGWFPGDRVGFGGRESGTLMRQWARLARTGSYRFSDFDGDALIAACAAPVLAVVLEGDDWAPRASTEHLLARAPSTVEWSGWSAGPGVDHNRWPRTPDVVAERVARWALEVATRPTSR